MSEQHQGSEPFRPLTEPVFQKSLRTKTHGMKMEKFLKGSIKKRGRNRNIDSRSQDGGVRGVLGSSAHSGPSERGTPWGRRLVRLFRSSPAVFHSQFESFQLGFLHPGGGTGIAQGGADSSRQNIQILLF